MILLCNRLVAGHLLWRWFGEEQSTHSGTNFLCHGGWWRNFAAVKCILKGMKSISLQKQNYSYDFWYIIKPFHAQRYHLIYTQIYSTIPAYPWSQLRRFGKKFSLTLVCCQVWCTHLACWTKQPFHTLPPAGLPSTWHNHPRPPSMVNLTSLLFLLCSVCHPSISFSFLLALAPAWIHLFPKPWIIPPSSPSPLLNLCGSRGCPYCYSSCSYTDFSNFMVVSPGCAVSGTTTPLLKAAFL